jgi:coatomer subunit beta
VAVNTNITNLREFVAHIIANTNMTCLIPLDDNNSVRACATQSVLVNMIVSYSQSANGPDFLAANLYARSVFGEDALVNVSVERKEDAEGKLYGYIRIRSKTQGIALSLGDRITSIQRIAAPSNGEVAVN